MEGYSFTEYFEKEVWIEGGMKQVMEAHRVVEVRGERLVTRGDSRPFRDRSWLMEWCRGRVVAGEMPSYTDTRRRSSRGGRLR